jgi:hypothetical protein
MEERIQADHLRYAALGEIDRPKAKVCSEASCLYAGLPQSPESFDPSPISKDGLSIRCRACNLNRRRGKSTPEQRKEYHRLWHERNREALNERTRQWRKENPQECRRLTVVRRFRQYGVTVEWYQKKLAAQGGVCAICGSPDPKSNGNTFHVDHDHRCCEKECHACDRCRRGLLCAFCNTRIAILENQEWLTQAQAYLHNFKNQVRVSG